MTTEQNLKIKLTFGYILLVLIFSLSILYILHEMKSLRVSKEDILVENTKVIQLSNAISDLYATENTSRLALLSYKPKDAQKYHQQLDSLIVKINQLKKDNLQNEALQNKVDTIIDLIQLKRLTFDQVRDVQQKYQKSEAYVHAQTEIKKIQASDKTIAIDTIVEKVGLWEKITTKRESQQKQRLKEENEKIVSRQKSYLDSIKKATENVLTKARKKEDKLLQDYYRKEALLINRNQELSKQLGTLLSEIEKIILQNSAENYEASKKIVDDVSDNIAKLGIIISIIALFFGLIVLRDLNKSSRYKRKLEELNLKMENLVEQKSFLMATISHDMVSPINSLMGFSTLLQKNLKTEKQKEYLTNIQQSTNYIKNMVDDLSLFSNLEFNNIKIKKSKFNFKELVCGILNNLKVNADRKNIDLVFEIDENLNQDFNSDPYRIQQILTNVISNAIKFTHKGSVKIQAKKDKNKVKIQIIDTGIGMKLENKEELYKEFFQAHDTNETIYGGSGLGLNITKRLIDLLHGSITFESELGKGTTFYIEIPITEFEEIETKKSEIVEYDNEKKLENKRILVIDDDPLQLKLLEEIFVNKVKKITMIEDGKLAKEILQKETYNLIVTDMQMPHYSGLKVIKDIRSLKGYEKTPVIALTGKIDFDDNEYKNLGFSMYLKKPLNINTLYNVIYKLLRVKTPKTENTTNEIMTESLKYPHFDLTDLYNLLDNDQDAVNEILVTFIENASKDLDKLSIAFQNQNLEDLKNTAHKMLPMFRQLKMNEAVESLLQLERNTDVLSLEEIEKEILITSEKVKEYLKELQKVIHTKKDK